MLDPALAQSTSDHDLTVLTSGRIEQREEKARLVTDDLVLTLLTIKFPVFDADGNVDGLGAIVTDITEQKQAEERFHDIVNTIEGIVWESDARTFDITYASKRAERMPIGDYLQRWNLPGEVINVEITEGLLMTTDVAVLDHLLQSSAAGIQVALDDFGTGYSSLAYLQKFDIDYIKIDRALICNLGPESDDLALCASIVAMAHTLGLEVIAEGIETEQHKNLLVRIGCDYGQGFYLGRPMSADELEHTYMRRRIPRLKPV